MGVSVDHICGQTFHGRQGKIANAFRYRVDYVLADMSARAPSPALFSRNRRNLLSLHDVDHGGARGAGQGVEWVRETLRAAGFDGLAVSPHVSLLAQPRVFGHVFNPVSFWLIHDPEDKSLLRMVIAEVNNTYGDRHSYLCHHDDLSPITPSDRLTARKIFHVSPFQPVAGTYCFRFDVSQDHVGVVIDYRTVEGGGVFATFHGKRRPLTNRSILSAALARPMGSVRVLALIHWQAAKLWWKGALFRARPEVPETEVSR